MKSIHFCTKKKLEELKKLELDEIFSTLRTWWIPNIYMDDIVKINERIDKKDTLLFHGKVILVKFEKYGNLLRHINDIDKEEISKYNRKFNVQHYFYQIFLTKIKNKENEKNA